MAERTGYNPKDEVGWHARGLRLTFFVGQPVDIEKLNWWLELVGNDPESRTLRPRAGELQEQGPFKEGSLTLGVRPERVDWNYLPIQKEETALEFAQLGPFEAALEVFVPPMLHWLQSCPPINRMALGAALFQPVKGKEDGYIRLSKYMNFVKLDPEGSSDFTYQINRPRSSESGVAGLRINRLSRWTVASVGTIQISPGIPHLQPISRTGAFATHVELDMNTSPEFSGNLPKEKLKGIFEELVHLAQEIAEQGDIP